MSNFKYLDESAKLKSWRATENLALNYEDKFLRERERERVGGGRKKERSGDRDKARKRYREKKREKEITRKGEKVREKAIERKRE